MPNLDNEVAVSFIRRLSNTENYPFHPEGEVHLAEVLQNHCDGATHARYVIDEFDEVTTCPSVAMLRDAANRLGEVCECGKAKWQHRDRGACARFAGRSEDDDGLTKTPTGYANFRESVPMIPGVPWEVCLQVASIRIGPREHELEIYPEACAAIRAGREPDYKLLEEQMNKRFPWMRIGSAGAKHARVSAGTGDRLKQVTTGYASTK